MNIEEIVDFINRSFTRGIFGCHYFILELCRNQDNLYYFYMKRAKEMGLNFLEFYEFNLRSIKDSELKLTGILIDIEKLMCLRIDPKEIVKRYEEKYTFGE